MKPKQGRRLRKTNRAQITALAQLGMNASQIEKRTGHSHHTIKNYLEQAEAYTDPDMGRRVERIKEKEILDLTVLNVEAKKRLHDLAPRMNPIEALATMDRSFQQIRLLEGKSTANIATLTKFIQEAHDAAPKREKSENDGREHQNGNGGRKASKTSRGNRVQRGGEVAQEEAVPEAVP